MPQQPQGGFETQDEVHVCCSEGLTNCFAGGSNVFNILFFQFLGMALFSYVVIAYNGIYTFPGVWIVQCGMFLSLVFAGSFGCGHLNPAVTIALFVRKQNRFSPLIGLLYWLVQYLAAFAGTFVAWAYNNNLKAPFPDVHTTQQSTLVTFGREIMGSFLFVFCILIMASADTTFTKTSAQVWFCVPLCLIVVCKVFNLLLGTNPAQAIAFQVAYYALSPNDTHATKEIQLSKIWSVIVGATIGGLVAGLVFQFVYRIYCKAYREQLIEKGEARGLKAVLNQSDDSPRRPPRRTTDIQMH